MGGVRKTKNEVRETKAAVGPKGGDKREKI
jgi:hypothetical protein